jgi:hypothetical protein
MTFAAPRCHRLILDAFWAKWREAYHWVQAEYVQNISTHTPMIRFREQPDEEEDEEKEEKKDEGDTEEGDDDDDENGGYSV